MTAALSLFRIVGLHGRRTMRIPIHGNTLILVGENGTGKSTVANCIYFFLTCQWLRLAEYKFDAIEAVIDGNHLVVEYAHINEHRKARGRHGRASNRFPPGVLRRVRDVLEVMPPHSIDDSAAVAEAIAKHVEIPAGIVQEIVREYLGLEAEDESPLSVVTNAIRSLIPDQLLYLPTYRRIEHDLKAVFRGMEGDLREFRERLARRKTPTSYVELVEFGMVDVEQAVAARLAAIKENVRTGLNNLTGTYLRDVIRGEHTKVDQQAIQSIEGETLDAMFARIDEVTLPTPDKERLRSKVSTIKNRGRIEPEDTVVAHFLSRLLELHKAQQDDEREVREFVKRSNGYLAGKRLVYDGLTYTLSIREDAAPSTDSSGELPMSALSSGEKQIVSLFSHIYCSGQPSFFVVIDEPELSLSVPWQRRFLPDILATRKCNGLLAVTHSPFIWENELEPFVHSLAEFTEEGDVLR